MVLSPDELSSQGSAGMVGCLKAQAGASDRHNPRRSWARGIHPLEHSLILAEAGSTGRLSFYCLTLEEKGAEKQLCPRLAHLYRENTWMEAVCPPHQTPNSVCMLSTAEERRVIFLLSRAKPGHKLALCKQRQALNSLDNLLQIICPALLINVCEALGGLNALEPSFT